MKNRAAVGVPARTVVAMLVVVSACASSAAADAAESDLGAPLCGVLTQLLPQVKTYRPEGARAQLVGAIAEQFEYDAVKLRRVRVEIDRVTIARCPKEREALLDVLKMKSLAEAVS